MKKSVKKTITYRISTSSITFSLSYLFLGSVTNSILLTILDQTLKCVYYYVHEHLWERKNDKS